MGKSDSSRTIKIVLLVSSILALLLMLRAAFEENFSGDWRSYQKAYRAELIDRAKNEKARETAESFEVRLRQVVLPELGRMDRCVTCHVGADNALMTDARLPIRKHSGTFLKDHPVERFGCTPCHDGQGLAVEKVAAHGQLKHWPTPRLDRQSVYTSCGRCHYENDLYDAEGDLFHGEGAIPGPIEEDELETAVPGSASIAEGKQLVLEHGCLGCHKYRGRGGVLGPEITHVGDKTVHDFDFAHVEGDHTVSQWLFEHFKNPEAVTPGTLMPTMGLSHEQAYQLKDYMLSLHRKAMPTKYSPVPPSRNGGPASGLQLYAMFCSACHGKDGQGSTVREPFEPEVIDRPLELMVPSLSHQDTLAVASDDYLRYIIRNGRPETTMIAWQGPFLEEGVRSGAAEGHGGLLPEEVERIVDHVRSWQLPDPDLRAVAAARGDARVGEAFFLFNCAACHGRQAQGDVGPSLNSPSFLGIASDEFLAESITDGRPNTAMPGWKRFDSRELSDLIAFLRSFHPLRSQEEEALKLAASRARSPDVSAHIGRTLYEANCTMCHGLAGEGDLAISLNTQEFLSIVGNNYLYETIARGRPGTGMPAWRHLTSEDVACLIRYIRTWQSAPSRDLPKRRLRGDWDTGEFLFAGLCTGCHGRHAEGGVGPQLNNPVFLKTATDPMLRAWISRGKTGTPMRAFIKGAQGAAEISRRQIDDIVSFLRSQEHRERVASKKSPSGRPELGKIWYAMVCAPCHGGGGEGASGPSLANRSFLHAASDGFLLATLARGRDGTEMRPLKKSPQSIVSFSSDQINDVVATLRLWESAPPSAGIPHRFVIPWDLGHGQQTYLSNCSGCHGIHGKAEKEGGRMSAWAPEINNEGFLAGATDGFLQATIVRGRIGTAMRPFGEGMQGLVDFSSRDIDDVVAFIRRWSSLTQSPMTIPAEFSLRAAPNVRAEEALPRRED